MGFCLIILVSFNRNRSAQNQLLRFEHIGFEQGLSGGYSFNKYRLDPFDSNSLSIGRKQAASLHSKKDTRHKSMGLKITADRIALMHKLNGNESPVRINDLVHADGSAAETEVLIKLPVIYL